MRRQTHEPSHGSPWILGKPHKASLGVSKILIMRHVTNHDAGTCLVKSHETTHEASYATSRGLISFDCLSTNRRHVSRGVLGHLMWYHWALLRSMRRLKSPHETSHEALRGVS